MNELFVCKACRHVDLVDLAQGEAARLGQPYIPFTCTQCLTGQWHQQFPYALYRPQVDRVCNPPIPPPCS